MIDVALIQKSFPEYDSLKVLSSHSGQKIVFRGFSGKHTIVLKIVKPLHQSIERLAREVEAVQSISSSYVPTIHCVGNRDIRGENFFFLVEDCIEGPTLRHVLENGGVPDLRAVEIIEAMVKACVDFEASRIVHRDLKPENVIVAKSGVWIIDFGIARHLDLVSLTATGYRGGVGTLGYAAPEQFNNIKAEISSRTDLYAIGVMAYELFTSKHPHVEVGKDPMAVLSEMEGSTLEKLRLDFDPEGVFVEWLWLLIQRFPSRRHQSAQHALAWLRDIKPKLQYN